MERHRRDKRVLLLHGGLILHYRVPIYNYLLSRFRDTGVDSLDGASFSKEVQMHKVLLIHAGKIPHYRDVCSINTQLRMFIRNSRSVS